jgi:hypothetical protein
MLGIKRIYLLDVFPNFAFGVTVFLDVFWLRRFGNSSGGLWVEEMDCHQWRRHGQLPMRTFRRVELRWVAAYPPAGETKSDVSQRG